MIAAPTSAPYLNTLRISTSTFSPRTRSEHGRACTALKRDSVDQPCNRRELILEAAGLAAVGLASPPPRAEAKKLIARGNGHSTEAFEFDIRLRLVALSGSVPGDWEQEFKQAMQGKAKMSLGRRSQLRDIYDELSHPEKKDSAATADAVTLSDSFLGPAIKAGLIQPLQAPEDQPWWNSLSPRWQQHMRRDTHGKLSKQGDIWGVPYRWGCTLIAFRTDRLNSRQGGKVIEDWKDLFQPALKSRLGFLAAPREFMGAVFKSLGLPFNTGPADLAGCGVSLDDLRERVQQLRQQVRQVSSREQQQALTAGDIWAAVGHSSELVPLALRHNNITLVAPASGTALWSDVWAVPRWAKGGDKQSGASPLLPAWLLYGLEPSRASRQRGLQGGASPLLLPGAVKAARCHADAPAARSSQLGAAGVLDLKLGELMPSDEVLERSEFLEPLKPKMKDLYWHLLQPG